ncbi:MAG: hypothetical protein HeimC2_07790 [Candidatus Heimdallarchaeota archaeon LC_2]|nr:MAG: hypothetical protein HeimC2_07760 [Candidatus Heimdallarchaeota archaeon LC_2]OLS28287.1 MAG: hypothetical protein HeimC2_07790 [Candidatus Heimdallarchaeota archaeon LC_2]
MKSSLWSIYDNIYDYKTEFQSKLNSNTKLYGNIAWDEENLSDEICFDEF